LAIGQSKSCFPKIDLFNEHDGGTNLSDQLLFNAKWANFAYDVCYIT